MVYLLVLAQSQYEKEMTSSWQICAMVSTNNQVYVSSSDLSYLYIKTPRYWNQTMDDHSQ
jgi:hypothetical protein